jgi:hypothetical protein
MAGARVRLPPLAGTGNRTDTQVARALADAGYLRVHVVDHDGQTWWEATIAGNALAQAGFGRPITRATAQRHLTGVIDRARTFNADGSHLIDITDRFSTFLDRPSWLEHEALLILRHRSAAINITLENVRNLGSARPR